MNTDNGLTFQNSPIALINTTPIYSKPINKKSSTMRTFFRGFVVSRMLMSFVRCALIRKLMNIDDD